MNSTSYGLDFISFLLPADDHSHFTIIDTPMTCPNVPNADDDDDTKSTT